MLRQITIFILYLNYYIIKTLYLLRIIFYHILIDATIFTCTVIWATYLALKNNYNLSKYLIFWKMTTIRGIQITLTILTIIQLFTSVQITITQTITSLILITRTYTTLPELKFQQVIEFRQPFNILRKMNNTKIKRKYYKRRTKIWKFQKNWQNFKKIKKTLKFYKNQKHLTYHFLKPFSQQ